MNLTEFEEVKRKAKAWDRLMFRLDHVWGLTSDKDQDKFSNGFSYLLRIIRECEVASKDTNPAPMSHTENVDGGTVVSCAELNETIKEATVKIIKVLAMIVENQHIVADVDICQRVYGWEDVIEMLEK